MTLIKTRGIRKEREKKTQREKKRGKKKGRVEKGSHGNNKSRYFKNQMLKLNANF